MNELIEKLYLTAKENPELEIIFFGSQDLYSDDYHWCIAAKIKEVSINEYTLFFDEESYTMEDDFFEETENYFNESDNYDENGYSDEIIEAFLNDLRQKGEIKKAIFVYIDI